MAAPGKHRSSLSPVPSRLASPASGTRTPSRPRNIRYSSRVSAASLPQDVESLALPEGAISAEATELLHEFVHPQHDAQDRMFDTNPTLPDEEVDDSDEASLTEIRKSLPWYKRPSPTW